VYLLLLFFGGIVVPASALPDGAAAVVRLLPSGALADGLAQATGAEAVGAGAWIVLAAWAVAALAAAVRWFRWD
jgi:ABC-2 type transport system permease protein